ncbi:AraC family transcriptional regulator [Kibdelosporangium phytohabitans]|uniref:AraC family transcriptional regulator n=1 Tax=Kibdelosporangium phytohabitans TaxID=860235 RepID=A0A0N9I5Y3_9PSEU|nr:AraC family transcriptional regulator [Kibdelosporangium phytohabitans]ALG10293.1 AraC family transcriptional regulator [Kibdelosporangium phytohabitans]MBE1461323.1 AraC-like DNA-binding protein [Kibdelosporangium phytohabitans]
MDALANLLDGPRARGAFLMKVVLDPPWSIHVRDEAPLALVTMVRGSGWVIAGDDSPVKVNTGDVVIARGTTPYIVADDPGTPPQVVIHPGDRCTTLHGEPLEEKLGLGVRTWGDNVDGDTMMLIGTYHMSGEVSRRLLDALPPMLIVPSGRWESPIIPVLADEIVKDEPAQAVVLDRLLDLVLITVLRAWFAQQDAETPPWYRAHGDPVVGAALRMIYNDPAHPWTVASLADSTGVSRATLARRFTELVGESPMAFLTDWRLALAADLLREPEATVGSVARKVGYGSSFALSAAFKRVRGVSPRAHLADQR